jgi:hypothetical protein
MDLSLLFLHRQGLAGWPRYAGPPDLPFAGLQSALGSLPSVALSSAGANGLAPWSLIARQRECFPFPFPWGSIGEERETAGDWRGRLS